MVEGTALRFLIGPAEELDRESGILLRSSSTVVQQLVWGYASSTWRSTWEAASLTVDARA